MKRIPKIYLDDFLSGQTALIKSRVRLVSVFFVTTFVLGSLITSLILHVEITRLLVHTWLLAAGVCVTTLVLSVKISTIRRARFAALLFTAMCLAVLARYYAVINEPPFNVAIAYVFAFSGFSLIFPWFPHEVISVLTLHLGFYTLFLLNVRTYIYKNNVVTVDVPDYLQGYVIMFLAFWVYFIVKKCEYERNIENFVLLKEIEEKQKQMHRELELATRVHSRLIPHSASTRLADIAVTYLPVSYMSGDYAKFHVIDKHKLTFIICDVTGHGVSAALLVNALNTEFERLVKEGKSPGVLLKEMDRFIVDDFASINMYLSAFCGLLNYRSRKFTYSSYGHTPQYIYRAANSEIEKIVAQTSFLGLPAQDENIYENEVPFRRGDQVLLFTDGLVEARGTKGEEYGDGRIEDFIRKNGALQVDLFNRQLLDEVNLFAERRLKDDIFVLNIKTK